MTMMSIREIIETEEGWRDWPYYCSEGYPTVGYGFKIGDRGDPLPTFKLPRAAGDAWLQCLVSELRMQLGNQISGLNEARQAIIISMAFQMGVTGIMGFKNMWAAIERKDWAGATDQMLDSRWARQTPARAHRHAIVMQTGSTEGVYP